MCSQLDISEDAKLELTVYEVGIVFCFRWDKMEEKSTVNFYHCILKFC